MNISCLSQIGIMQRVYMNTNGHICIHGKFLFYRKLPNESGCYIMRYKSISNVDAPQATSTFDQIEYLHALFSLGKQRSMKCIVTWKDCIPSISIRSRDRYFFNAIYGIIRVITPLRNHEKYISCLYVTMNLHRNKNI